ncbi:MAG TPA: hypothetical protein VNB90_08075 [Cytophagaceae bacterium]|jgi:hypothetical protein|nr:hypothetical protein [Cytophagaceae bacterium]
MNVLFSIHWILVAAIWYTGNGILHDIFVLLNHKGKYDRELLRLLMDGHVLILSGILLVACYLMVLSKIQSGAMIALIVGAGMLVYCVMIFPFLKSFATIALSIWLMVVAVRALNSFPNIYEIMQKYK